MRGGGFVCGAPSELSDVQVPPGISIGGRTRGCTSKISIGGETSSALTKQKILLQILCDFAGDSANEEDRAKANELMQIISLLTLNFAVEFETVLKLWQQQQEKQKSLLM